MTDVYDLAEREPVSMACSDCGAQFSDPETIDDDEFGLLTVEVTQCPACYSTSIYEVGGSTNE